MTLTISGKMPASFPVGSDAINRLLAAPEGFSLEISNRRGGDVDDCRAQVPPGTPVFVAFGPKDSWAETVASAVRLRRAGFAPVPHLAARLLPDAVAFDALVARLCGEAGVETVFVVGGDRDRSCGAFSAAIELVRTGALARHGIRRVGFAGYPEGHPRISEMVLLDALADKLALAADQGLAPFVVTQFCFAAPPIAAWLDRYRARGLTAPVRLGLAGPASVTTLARFGLRCGIGGSMRALRRDGARLARLARDVAPDAVLRDVAGAEVVRSDRVLSGLHVFTFGGVVKTMGWIRTLRPAVS